MGKKRIAVLEKEKKEVRVPGLKGGQRVVVVAAEPLPEEKPVTTEIHPEAPQRTKPPRKRGKKYLAMRTKIDPTKTYPLTEAIKLLKETFYARFDGTAEAHLVTFKAGLHGETALPYFQGKNKKVEIADEQTLKKIEARKIDFDILISTPAFMPNLVKYAKVLGPKGLMPNPKAGTITEDPTKVAEKFQEETFSFKTESNAPLIHTVFGKVSQKEEELIANLQALVKAIGTKNIKRVIIKSTMGPGIKVDLTTL